MGWLSPRGSSAARTSWWIFMVRHTSPLEIGTPNPHASRAWQARQWQGGTTSGAPDMIRLYGALARQLRRSHQEFVDSVRGLAAFADRPDHQRLAAPDID